MVTHDVMRMDEEVCDYFRWDYLMKRDDYSINLFPSPHQISKVNVHDIMANQYKKYQHLKQVHSQVFIERS